MKTLFLTSILSLNLFSAECDQFTKRDEPLNDSSDFINRRANEIINKSIEKLNSEDARCDEKLLYKELTKYFENHIQGKFTKEILESNEVSKRIVPMQESIFKNWSPWDGIGMGLWFMKNSDITLTSVVKMGDATIGTDKFEHFFGQGFKYFSINYLEDKGATKALKVGIFKEKFFLGGNKLGNGVFSFGDLSANFNGMRFWNHMLLKRDDILGKEHNLGPYVVCENGKWKKGIDIDFKNYIDDSMDEAINCSKFPSGSTVRKMEKNVAYLGLKCPIDQSRFDQMAKKYGDYSKWILNFDGFDTVNYFGEFKN